MIYDLHTMNKYVLMNLYTCNTLVIGTAYINIYYITQTILKINIYYNYHKKQKHQQSIN